MFADLPDHFVLPPELPPVLPPADAPTTAASLPTSAPAAPVGPNPTMAPGVNPADATTPISEPSRIRFVLVPV